MAKREGRVSVDCRVVDRSTSAILIDVEQDAGPDLRVWVPLSTVHEVHTDKAGHGSIVCDEWIAKKKGLV
jgi:hypothetical protein